MPNPIKGYPIVGDSLIYLGPDAAPLIELLYQVELDTAARAAQAQAATEDVA